MKPVQIVISIGALAIAGLGGWYMYMQATPQYQKAAQRGLDQALIQPGSVAPAPSTLPIKPAGDVLGSAAPSAAASAEASAAGSAAPSAAGSAAPSAAVSAP